MYKTLLLHDAVCSVWRELCQFVLNYQRLKQLDVVIDTDINSTTVTVTMIPLYVHHWRMRKSQKYNQGLLKCVTILHKLYSYLVVKNPKIFVATNLWNYINVDGYIELSGIDLQLECYNFIFALWY